jgi:hypothetical protein
MRGFEQGIGLAQPIQEGVNAGFTALLAPAFQGGLRSV